MSSGKLFLPRVPSANAVDVRSQKSRAARQKRTCISTRLPSRRPVGLLARLAEARSPLPDRSAQGQPVPKTPSLWKGRGKEGEQKGRGGGNADASYGQADESFRRRRDGVGGQSSRRCDTACFGRMRTSRRRKEKKEKKRTVRGTRTQMYGPMSCFVFDYCVYFVPLAARNPHAALVRNRIRSADASQDGKRLVRPPCPRTMAGRDVVRRTDCDGVARRTGSRG